MRVFIERTDTRVERLSRALLKLMRVWAGEQKVELPLRILSVIGYMLVMNSYRIGNRQFAADYITNHNQTEKYHANNTKHFYRKNRYPQVQE